MSRANLKKVKNFDFVDRFIEVCDTSQAADIARLLNISYQAAKNYLEGRLPDSNVLISIAEQTNYSIHWLLTGQGEKFANASSSQSAPLLSSKLREFVRRECREMINETLSNMTAQQKILVLSPEKINEERVLEEARAFSGNGGK